MLEWEWEQVVTAVVVIVVLAAVLFIPCLCYKYRGDINRVIDYGKKIYGKPTKEDWARLKKEIVCPPTFGDFEQVKSINDFLDPERRFLGTANHFTLPVNSPVNFSKQHHLIAKSKVYPEGNVCKITVRHFTDVDSDLAISKFEMEFSTDEPHELVDGSRSGGAQRYLDLLKEGKWYMVTDEDYPITEKERDDAWDAAEDSIGQKEYMLLFNNCEHFVTSILKKSSESRQVIQGFRYAAGAALSSALSSTAFAIRPLREAASRVSATLLSYFIEIEMSPELPILLQIPIERINQFYPNSLFGTVLEITVSNFEKLER